MNMWQILKDFVSGVAAFLRFREKRQDIVNAPEMTANAAAARDAAMRDAANKAVAKGDLDEIRKRAAE